MPALPKLQFQAKSLIHQTFPSASEPTLECVKTLLPLSARLTDDWNARQVAVSLRHAALVTHRGEMYTWGHGTGGKLGLGNHQNADSPQRVYTLWGKSVKRVSCGGQSCTAVSQHYCLQILAHIVASHFAQIGKPQTLWQ